MWLSGVSCIPPLIYSLIYQREAFVKSWTTHIIYPLSSGVLHAVYMK